MRLMLVAAAAALVLLLAACGGDDDGDGGVASLDEDTGSDSDGSGDSDDDGDGNGGRRPSPEEQAEFQDAMLEYVECMREQGIDMPDPEFSDDGGVMITGGMPLGDDPASQEAFEAADAECKPILDEAMPDLDLSPEEIAELQDEQVALAQCMRDRGYDFPDPVVNENGSVDMRGEAGGPAAPGSPENEQFDEDMDACAEEAGLGNGGPGEAVDGGGE